MAKKKYVSKGQRNSVNTGTLKAVKRSKKTTVFSMLQSAKAKEFIVTSKSKINRELKAKYLMESEVTISASRLINRFGKCGLTWAGAVQAVKTDYIEILTKKWNKILRKFNEEQAKNSSLFSSR